MLLLHLYRVKRTLDFIQLYAVFDKNGPSAKLDVLLTVHIVWIVMGRHVAYHIAHDLLIPSLDVINKNVL